MRKRLIEIDRITGIAILLVVVGHVVARQPPEDADWYIHLKYAIYKFHMPLFMFCSGLVFQYTYASWNDEIRVWIKRRILRLAPGFLLIGVAILCGKLLAHPYIHVDKVPSGLVEGFVDLFLFPKQSAAGSLWYIYALLLFSVLLPIAYKVLRLSLQWALVVAVGMHVIHLIAPLPKLFMVNALFEYALFFVLGAWCSYRYERFIELVRRLGPGLVLVFVLSFFTVWLVDEKASKMVIGLTSIPAMAYLAAVRLGSQDRWLLQVAKYTYTIYLFNTIFIGLTKGLLLEIAPWDGANFYWFFVALTLAGVLLPIVFYTTVLSRVPVLSKQFI